VSGRQKQGSIRKEKEAPTGTAAGAFNLLSLSWDEGRENSTREPLRGLPGNHAALIAIFFSAFCASTLFGTETFSTPFLKDASILS
jgi:hypothetical protein